MFDLYSGKNPWFDFIVTALAGWQIVETYHHGSIFARIRDIFETNADESWLSGMMSCVFCFSHWVFFLLVAVAASIHLDSRWTLESTTIAIEILFLRGVVLALAGLRVAQFGNDVLKQLRTAVSIQAEAASKPSEESKESNGEFVAVQPPF